VPVVTRLTGTNEAAAHKILKTVKLESAPTLDEVVQKAIAMAGLNEE